MGYAFINADEVECNLLWCSAKKTVSDGRTIINDSIIIESHRTCFLNGYEIDCDDNRTTLPKQITDGNFDKEPIYKYEKKWVDVLNTGSDKE